MPQILRPAPNRPALGTISYYVEKAVGKVLGLDETLAYAEKRPSELGIPDDAEGHGGKEDALRHLLLSAELHRTKPMIADVVLRAHEDVTGRLDGASKESRDQDLANNALGREIGRTSKSREEMEARVLEALPKAVIISTKKALDNSFNAGFLNK